MIKKVFRPFWSYDVQKTEEWLSLMSEKGYHFLKMNRHTRCFFFREGEPGRITYEIGYDVMKGNPLPRALAIDGWQKIFQNKNWYIMLNDKPTRFNKNII